MQYMAVQQMLACSITSLLDARIRIAETHSSYLLYEDEDNASLKERDEQSMSNSTQLFIQLLHVQTSILACYHVCHSSQRPLFRSPFQLLLVTLLQARLKTCGCPAGKNQH